MAFDYSELQSQLALRQEQQLYRNRYTLESPQGVEVRVNGKSYLNFCSNDYLGLANHPEIVATVQNKVSELGFGGGASHLVCGHHDSHHQLEEVFAELTGRDSAVLFSTGFMANMGIIQALCDKQDAVIEDKWNHASLIDGGLISGAKFSRYLHNDMNSLQARLEKTQARRKLVCADGVFSMDGDIAPVAQMAQITRDHDGLLLIDDAHGFGCLGENGLGVCEQAGVTQDDVPLLMCTLGKALGSFGALVAGPKVLMDYLVQYARPYIYTTSMPPVVAEATMKSLSLLTDEAWRREKLADNIQCFVSLAKDAGLPLMISETAIQPLLVEDEGLALECQGALQESGYWISAIRTPTVPKGKARLRITLTAEHTQAHIEQLVQQLSEILSRLAPQLMSRLKSSSDGGL